MSENKRSLDSSSVDRAAKSAKTSHGNDSEDFEGFDCAAATAKIITNYVEITNLPVNLILQELLVKKVILSRQMEMIEDKLVQSERMEYILDKIILPSLEFDISTHYIKFLEVMESSDNEKLNSMAQKLGMNGQECPAVNPVKTTASLPAAAATITTTTATTTTTTTTTTATTTISFDSSAAKAKIFTYYAEILNLPFELIRRELFARKVITPSQKEMIETFPLQRQRMGFFLDKIIIPTLKFNGNKLKSFLEVMEESGDEKLTSVAEKLGGSKAIP